jgi:hypothetical protein
VETCHYLGKCALTQPVLFSHGHKLTTPPLGFDRACGDCAAEYQLVGSDAVVAFASFAPCDVGILACTLYATMPILRHNSHRAASQIAKSASCANEHMAKTWTMHNACRRCAAIKTGWLRCYFAGDETVTFPGLVLHPAALLAQS